MIVGDVGTHNFLKLGPASGEEEALAALKTQANEFSK